MYRDAQQGETAELVCCDRYNQQRHRRSHRGVGQEPVGPHGNPVAYQQYDEAQDIVSGLVHQVAERSRVLSERQRARGRVHHGHGYHGEEEDEQPDHPVSVELAYILEFLCHHFSPWVLQLSDRGLELASAVFVVFEQIEAGAAGREQDYIPVLGQPVGLLHRLFGR